jgi:hypothetical protein
MADKWRTLSEGVRVNISMYPELGHGVRHDRPAQATPEPETHKRAKRRARKQKRREQRALRCE